MEPLTFISLFAGIGGIDLGLERAGMRCVAQVEIDDYCTRVLAKHWPDVRRFRDVRSVGAHNLPRADVIAGGFPCQDISNAGKRAGITGERSGLWSEYSRIIRELRPRYVLVENVAALLVRGIDAVLGDLAEIGYDAEWQSIPAAAVGAPHLRDRLFIVAYTTNQLRRQINGIVASGERESKSQTQEWAVCQGNGSTNDDRSSASRSALVYADSNPTRREQRSDDETTERGQPYLSERFSGGRGSWGVEPDVGRVAYGVPARLDRLRGLGNAVVPDCAEFVGRAIVEHHRAMI